MSAFSDGVMPMLVAPHLDVERKDDDDPPSAQSQAREIDCNSLAERVLRSPRRTGYFALHAVDVTVWGGAVILRGMPSELHEILKLNHEEIRTMPVQASTKSESNSRNASNSITDSSKPIHANQQALIEGLNNDLGGEYQAILMYIQYSAKLTGPVPSGVTRPLPGRDC
jgi:hypothetical protein